MNRIKTSKISLFLIIVAIFFSTLPLVFSIPPIATELYGTAKLEVINGTNATFIDAPIGLNITAYDPDGILCGRFTVVNEGYYGLLSCTGDDTESSIDEGAESGDNITFRINGSSNVYVSGYTIWGEGEYRYVNITLGTNHPPTFDHELSNQSVGDNHQLLYDINCSDQDGDSITYYSNSTLFAINSSSGMIDWTPTQSQVGNYTFNVSCGDEEYNISGLLNIEVFDINNPPILNPIGNQIAIEDVLFTLTVSATDPDNDTLNFTANSSIFTIGLTTGLISFTPTLANVGNYTINISVTDGEYTDFEIISFRIVRGPYCGDSSCSGAENCLTCPSDCGACPPGGEGGTGTGTGTSLQLEEEEYISTISYFPCRERWQCTDWNICLPTGVQSRTCIDVNDCGTSANKPYAEQRCEYEETCEDGIQNQGESGIDCGGPCNPCIFIPTCEDGIQNQGESGIDCGGPCNSCTEEEREIPQPSPKRFPWAVLIAIAILISITTTGDTSYIKHISKMKVEEFKKRIIKYKPIRRKLYETILFTSLMLLIITFYIYIVQYHYLKEHLGILIMLIILIPAVSALIIIHFEYQENKKKKKEATFERTHLIQGEFLTRLEESILFNLEKKTSKDVFDLYQEKRLNKYPPLYNSISPAYTLLRKIAKTRKERVYPPSSRESIKGPLAVLVEDKKLLKLADDYIEFNKLFISLKKLLDEYTSGKESLLLESNFMTMMEDIASDAYLKALVELSEFSSVYNYIVDIYDKLKEKFDLMKEKEKELVILEGDLMKKVEDISKKDELVNNIKKESEIAKAYNGVVDLYNHYNKRKQQRTLIQK